jgi:plasmid stabilization system protein ParE
MEIILKNVARKRIKDLLRYIEDKGNPLNAERYNHKIISFIEGLSNNPHPFPLCERKVWRTWKLQCIVFDGKYIIAYKTVNDKLIIYNFAHGSKIR